MILFKKLTKHKVKSYIYCAKPVFVRETHTQNEIINVNMSSLFSIFVIFLLYFLSFNRWN